MAPSLDLVFTPLYSLSFCFGQPNGVESKVVALVINYLCALLTERQSVTYSSEMRYHVGSKWSPLLSRNFLPPPSWKNPEDGGSSLL
jgi:hypothetical protein